MSEPLVITIPVPDGVEFTEEELCRISDAALRVVEPIILDKRGQ